VRKTHLYFTLAFLLISYDVMAKEIPDSPTVPAPVSAVVTAARVEQSPESVSSSMTVITRQDIERQKARTVVEALRNVPGLHLQKSGGPGRLTTPLLRGANANQTLVLIDNVQVNSPTTGDYDLSKLTTENVERIEVIRGPQSALYGSDAMAGVIHVITRKGTPKPELDSFFEYGSRSTFFEGQSFAGRWKDASLATSWSRFDTNGLGDNDEVEDTNVATQFNASLTDQLDAGILYRYSNGIVGIEDGAFRTDPNNHSNTRQNILGTSLEYRPREEWKQELRWTFFHDRLFSFDPPDPGTAQADSRFKLDTDAHRLDWQHTVSLGEHDTLTGGYEFEHSRSNNKTFDKITRNHAWYLNNLLELYERLYLTAGARVEDNSAFGFEMNPKVGAAYLHHETSTKFKANFGTAYRAPTYNQLFFPGFGNPGLAPEESIGFDTGVEQDFLSEKIFTGGTYFYNYYQELIGGFSSAVNEGKSRTQGLELEGGLRPFHGFEFKCFYTYLKAETIASRSPLIRRPRHSGGADFNWTLFDRVHWNVNWTMFGKRVDSTGNASRPLREINPSFSKLDTTFSVDVHRFVEVYARIENLTNDDDDEVLGFDAPGTQFFGGVRIKLA
jgi:vitamin B12 transporter